VRGCRAAIGVAAKNLDVSTPHSPTKAAPHIPYAQIDAAMEHTSDSRAALDASAYISEALGAPPQELIDEGARACVPAMVCE